MAVPIVVESQKRSQMVTAPGGWSAGSTPAVNAQATTTQGAPGSGYQLIVTNIVARLTADTTAPSATACVLNLIFGTTGQPASLSWNLTLEATAGDRDSLVIGGLAIEVTPATACTLEFAAAGGSHTFQSVMLTGYIRNVTPPDWDGV